MFVPFPKTMLENRTLTIRVLVNVEVFHAHKNTDFK
jgi:hypothetical protein